MVMEIKEKCRWCNGSFVQTQTEIVCSKCGVVHDDVLVDNTFDYDMNEIGNGRTGPPVNPMYKDSMSSEISKSNKDGSGNYIKGEARSMVNRIRQWDKRQKSSGTRTRSIANGEVVRICNVLSIPENVMQRAAEIYRDCEARKMMRGRTTTIFACSCVYAACRERGIARTLNDFTDVCYARRTDITSYYRMIVLTLDIKTKIMKPEQYISRIASKTSPPLPVSMQRFAINTINKLKSNAGRDPVGLAAAALYYAAINNGLNFTQRAIALAAGVTEVTIRHRVNGIKDELDDE